VDRRLPRGRFVDDSPLEGAVSSELVSGRPKFPCYAGKIQGIFIDLPSVARVCRQNDDYNQCLTSKFPTRRNRELIGPYQGIKSAYQGSFCQIREGRSVGGSPKGIENRKLIRAD